MVHIPAMFDETRGYINIKKLQLFDLPQQKKKHEQVNRCQKNIINYSTCPTKKPYEQNMVLLQNRSLLITITINHYSSPLLNIIPPDIVINSD